MTDSTVSTIKEQRVDTTLQAIRLFGNKVPIGVVRDHLLGIFIDFILFISVCKKQAKPTIP